MNAHDLTLLVAAGLGGGGISTMVTKWLNRGNDSAAAEDTRAGARGQDIDNLRNIITEVRQSEALKTQRIDQLEQRLERLEERERHMLTRAAVHEAWDALAFQRIILGDEHFPPPPPLSIDKSERDGLADDGRPD